MRKIGNKFAALQTPILLEADKSEALSIKAEKDELLGIFFKKLVIAGRKVYALAKKEWI